MIRYQITSHDPATHYFKVRILIDNPDPEGQCLRLPNWIPGSYMIRDFAKNLVTLDAYSDEQPLAIAQLDKSNWRVAPCSQALRVEYLVYAKDLSVRGAHLDHTHGYYNGASVFLEVLGQSDSACEVLIEKPAADYCQKWKLATTLKRIDAGRFGFGLFRAQDYDELIDHPVEMGEFGQVHFEACGVPHDIILSGQYRCDEARLAQDLKTVCEHHIRFFGEPAPMDTYQFLVMVVGEGYGGLEHRSSTSLICSRDSLPQPGQKEVSEDYRTFLGLCSHEYFHTWNVKRIRPAAYQPYALQQEVYSELLWAFEGITSYYDDLALVRTGLIDESSYLELLAQTMTRVQRGLGRTRQSAAESSFNTWSKFYQQDENAQNAIVSYYAKGALIALCIDLKMRELSDSSISLDEVMRSLWQNWCDTGAGVEADTIQNLVCTLVDNDLHEYMHQLISTTDELPLDESLAVVGVDVMRRQAANQKDKGGKPKKEPLPGAELGAFLKERVGGLEILRVEEGGAAQLAGLSAGDTIVAINSLKQTLAQIEQRLKFAQAGEQWTIHAFRRDELYCVELMLRPAQRHTIELAPTENHRQYRQSWLGGR
ncbi:MAG: M61 family metallopeptidase [Gammaproteobacteria bacterium]